MLSYERASNLLMNDTCIAKIGQVVLELLLPKVTTGNPHRIWKLSFSDFSKSPLVKNGVVWFFLCCLNTVCSRKMKLSDL